MVPPLEAFRRLWANKAQRAVSFQHSALAGVGCGNCNAPNAHTNRIRDAERSIMDQLQRAGTDEARGSTCMAKAADTVAKDPIGALHFAQMACQFFELGEPRKELAEGDAMRGTVLAAFKFFDEAENLARKAVATSPSQERKTQNIDP